jgi:hypothetical protein
VARVQTDGGHAEFAQAVPVPGAYRAGLEADPHRARRPRADDDGASPRLRGHAAAPHGGALASRRRARLYLVAGGVSNVWQRTI